MHVRSHTLYAKACIPMHMSEISTNLQNAEISPVNFLKSVFHPSKLQKFLDHSQEIFAVELLSVWL